MLQMRLGVLPVMMASTTPRTLEEILRQTRRYIKERAKHTMTKPNCKLFDILEHSQSEQRPADKLIRK